MALSVDYFAWATRPRKIAKHQTRKRTDSCRKSHNMRVSWDAKPCLAAYLRLYLTGIRFVLKGLRECASSWECKVARFLTICLLFALTARNNKHEVSIKPRDCDLARAAGISIAGQQWRPSATGAARLSNATEVFMHDDGYDDKPSRLAPTPRSKLLGSGWLHRAFMFMSDAGDDKRTLFFRHAKSLRSHHAYKIRFLFTYVAYAGYRRHYLWETTRAYDRGCGRLVC